MYHHDLGYMSEEALESIFAQTFVNAVFNVCLFFYCATSKHSNAFRHWEPCRVAIQYLTLDPKEGLQLSCSCYPQKSTFCVLLFWIVLQNTGGKRDCLSGQRPYISPSLHQGPSWRSYRHMHCLVAVAIHAKTASPTLFWCVLADILVTSPRSLFICIINQ